MSLTAELDGETAGFGRVPHRIFDLKDGSDSYTGSQCNELGAGVILHTDRKFSRPITTHGRRCSQVDGLRLRTIGITNRTYAGCREISTNAKREKDSWHLCEGKNGHENCGLFCFFVAEGKNIRTIL